MRFTVPGNPIPWERTRLDQRTGRFVTGRRSRDHRYVIQVAARAARVRCLDGPVRLSLAFYRATAHACDLDNLAKAVQDALIGFAYVDDRQIVRLAASKEIDAERPRTEVEVDAVEGPRATRIVRARRRRRAPRCPP